METPTQKPEVDYKFLATHLTKIWTNQGNLNGVTLPDGTDNLTLYAEFLRRDMSNMTAFMDECACLPRETNPITQALEALPDDTSVRCLVPWGTPGAISLDMCPEGTLITTLGDLRERMQKGLRVLSIMPTDSSQRRNLFIGA